jgi:nucleoid DNA-binding protein
MAKLTKRDIVVSISNQTGMVQHQVFDVVQKTLDKITDSLANNVPVELRNFGVFLPRLTRPRIGRNPNQPGSSFVIPPRATVKFKAGKIMRQRVEKLSHESGEQALDRFLQALKINRLRQMFGETCFSGLVHILFAAETAQSDPRQTFVETHFAH